MSLDRASTSSETQQYASTTDPATSSRPFNTMPSASSRNSNNSPSSRLQIYSTQVPQAWVTPFCGAGAGVASGIATCPLDVIKTKLQAQGGLQRRAGKPASSATMYKGMIGTARVIWREEGLRGMYRGLGPMLLGYLPTWAVYLSVYEKSRSWYHDRLGNWWLARGSASITAGACSTILTNPIWVIKTRLMSQSTRSSSDGFRAPWHYTSTIDAARKMYHAEGIRAFYSGLSPALLGLTHVAVQFPLYEYFKMTFTGYGIGEHPAGRDESSHWVGISAATFLSKVCASTATYPHEVLRTRLQTQQHSSDRARPPGPSSSDGMPTRPMYKGVIRTCRTILAEEGWKAFYAGIGTNLIRAVPAAMTTMLTYEYLQKLIKHMQTEGHQRLEEQLALGEEIIKIK